MSAMMNEKLNNCFYFTSARFFAGFYYFTQKC